MAFESVRTFDYVRAWKQEFEASGWWHSFELSDGRIVEGRCKLDGLKARLANFPVPADLTGKRVLDIGTWDGWYAFEMARRGAEVVAVDCWDNPRFYEMRRMLGFETQVDYRLLDVYDIAPETLGRFDIVLFFGVLYHLKHPLLALERVCSVTTELCCVDSFVLREPQHGQDLEFNGRAVMEFFETDEFGGQTDNWVAPSAGCLAAFCRTAGFARVEPAASLDYSASFACYRRWLAPQIDWGEEPRLEEAFHHFDFGLNFSSRRDEYVVAWFSANDSQFSIKDVYPEVSGFGVQPIRVARQGAKWMVTFKLPPGLEAGWHDVRLRVKDSRLSAPVRIAVEMPLVTEGIRIVKTAELQDDILAIWVAGLRATTDRRSLRATVDGWAVEIAGVEPPGNASRRVDLLIPGKLSPDPVVAITLGAARAECRIREVGTGTSGTG